MTFSFYNPIENISEHFDSKEEAELRLSVVKQQFLEQEAFRFSIVRQSQSGENVIWTTANLDLEEEINTYLVFNHITGQHESFSRLSEAKLRNLELKEAFLSDVFSTVVDDNDLPRPIQITELQ